MNIAQLTPSQREQMEAHKARRARIAARSVVPEKPRDLMPKLDQMPVAKPRPTREEELAAMTAFFKKAWKMLGADTDDTKPSIAQIQQVCAKYYDVSRADICSARRTANVVRPRQVGMYLAKVLTLRSLPEVGRFFGGRDHTTVLHAVRKIERLITTDPKLAEDVSNLREILGK